MFGYPIWIAFMEAAQTTGFAVLAAVLKRRATRPVHCLALFAIFPVNFAFDTLGAGFPTVIVQNSSVSPSQWLLVPSAFVSVALAATALWWTAQLLVQPRAVTGAAPTPQPAGSTSA